jgi:hypothetical protein
VTPFVYWTLRRLIELVAARGLGESAKEIELVVLRDEIAMLRRNVFRGTSWLIGPSSPHYHGSCQRSDGLHCSPDRRRYAAVTATPSPGGGPIRTASAQTTA